MGKYFNRFPQVYYSLSSDGSNPEAVTDVTFPVRILEKYMTDARFYYKTVVKDGLKPEDIAYIVYGDATLHWVVLQFNKIINPRFDWPLSSLNLDKYIADKYGSVSQAQATTIKWYKIIKYLNSSYPNPVINQIEVTQDEYNAITIDLAGGDVLLADGSTLTIITDRTTLSAYDYELNLNESKREIYLIQKQYIDGIKSSFVTLTK